MKKTFILLPLIGLLLFVILSGSASGPGLTGDGDRTGATGTPGCAGSSCHSTSAGPIKFSLQLYDATGTTVVSSYVGGTSYKIRMTAANAGTSVLPKFGFQITAVSTLSSTTSEGTLGTITSTHLGVYSSINIVEHSSAFPATTGTGSTGSTYVVNIPWTAPSSGAGSVTFYAVVNCVNNSGTADVVDQWTNGSVVIGEAVTVAPITGTLTVCAGATTKLSDATPGGAWTSGTTTVATVGAGGIVAGVAAGTSVITYTVGSSFAIATVTVNPLPATGTITGPTSVCLSSTVALTDAVAGGAWTSSTTTVATVGGSGVVTGVALGTATISYSLTNSCGTASATHTVSVITTPTAGAITGATVTCIGKTIALTDATTSGVWTSTATTIATVGTSGIVAGGALGTATISYTVTNSCGTASVAHTVTVKATSVCAMGSNIAPAISGTELKVYPNPNTGVFTINLESEDNSDAQVSITNIVGVVVKEFTTVTNKQTEIQLYQPAGIYFLTVRTAQGIFVSRLVVE